MVKICMISFERVPQSFWLCNSVRVVKVITAAQHCRLWERGRVTHINHRHHEAEGIPCLFQ